LEIVEQFSDRFALVVNPIFLYKGIEVKKFIDIGRVRDEEEYSAE